MPNRNPQPKDSKGDLLIVDDDVSALHTLGALLTREGYEIRSAPNGQTALMFAQEDPPELILLDIRLPDMDGFQVCRRLKENPQTSNSPVIFISGLEEIEDKVKGFSVGGVDYITKPFQGEELLARVDTHLTLRRLQKKVESQNEQLTQAIARSKLAEEKIKQAAEEWRTTFDSIKDLISIHDKDYRIVRANQAFAAAFSMEIREVLGKKCSEVIHGTGEPGVACPHQKTMVSGKPMTEEFFEPRLGKYLQVSTSPILKGQDEVTGSVHIVKDITERKRAEEALRKAHDELEERVKERTLELLTANEQLIAFQKALEGHLRFQSLLAEISVRFVNLPSELVEPEIKECQRRVCETLGIDFSSLWLAPDEDRERMLLAQVHSSREVSIPEKLDARMTFPWTLEKVLSGEILAIARLGDLPPEADRDQASYRLYDTHSSVAIPLSMGSDRVFGVLTFGVAQERDWPEPVVTGLQLVAQVFANALARKHADETLRESEARLSLAASSGEIGLWSVGLRGGQIWGTEKGWELLGFPPGSRVTQDSFYDTVHSEDRERVRDTIEQAIRGGKRRQGRIPHRNFRREHPLADLSQPCPSRF